VGEAEGGEDVANLPLRVVDGSLLPSASVFWLANDHFDERLEIPHLQFAKSHFS
jgi:hypothetical protein